MLVTTDFVPYPGGNGPSILTWGFIEGLLAHGVEPTIAILCPGSLERHEDRLRFLREKGVAYRIVRPSSAESVVRTLVRKLRPRLVDVYPAVLFRTAIGELCDELQPECVAAFSAQSMIPILAGENSALLRILLCADLDHENRYLRLLHYLRYGEARRRYFGAVFETLGIRKLRREFVDALRGADEVFSFARHTADWMIDHGAANVSYFPAPVPDLTRDAPVAKRPSKARFLLLGGYAGLVTRTSMNLVARSILPALDRELGAEGYELHWVGRNDGLPPRLLRSFAAHPAFIQRGFVENLSLEYAQAHAVLVPTPLAIGARIRLVEALSYGAAVVAHSSNLLPMPELREGRIVCIADDGPQVAAACRRILADPEMAAALRRAGRRHYERYHLPGNVLRPMLDRIEQRLSAKDIVAV